MAELRLVRATEGRLGCVADAEANLTHALTAPGQAAFAHVFAGDLPAEEGAALVKHQKPIKGASFGEKATVAAWHVKPTYYAISANDLMLPPPAEAMFAERMKATTVTLPSSHASPVSHPDEVAALIDQAAMGRRAVQGPDPSSAPPGPGLSPRARQRALCL